jgi:hypothetical protein
MLRPSRIILDARFVGIHRMRLSLSNLNTSTYRHGKATPLAR